MKIITCLPKCFRHAGRAPQSRTKTLRDKLTCPPSVWRSTHPLGSGGQIYFGKTIYDKRKNNLTEIANIFTKLGCFSFGGPTAHIAMMEKEIVEKRQWMTHEHYLDFIGATNLIPGPNSTEMAIHCGYQRGGQFGLWIAGICFIVPAVIMTTLFAWFYKQYGTLPAIEPIFYGIKPAVIAIILDAVYKFGKKALKNWQLGFIGLAVIIAALFGIDEIFLLLFPQTKTDSNNIG